MGFMLKEALQALCGVNHWAYAVFWKFSRHSPKLLIWEECYYGPESLCIVDKMMMDNHVSIVGQGLVGSVAFTGNYQWVLSGDYYRESLPPEVLKEVSLQFSTGMQTVTAIPVLPYGVVQFGSYSTIAEDLKFVNEVLSLIIQLEHVSGVLQCENYAAKEVGRDMSVPEPLGYSTHRDLHTTDAYSFISNNFNFVGNSAETSASDSQLPCTSAGEFHNDKLGIVASFQSDFPLPNQFIGRAVGVPSVEANGLYGAASSSNMKPVAGIDSLSYGNGAACEIIASECNASCGPGSSNLPRMEASLFGSVEHLTKNSLLADQSYVMNTMSGYSSLNHSMPDMELNIIDSAFVQPRSRDDLFDVLGAEFKSRIIGSHSRNLTATPAHNNTRSKRSLDSSEISSTSHGNKERAKLSSTGPDHLLDAVVSKVHPSVLPKLDENVSCGTSLTNMNGNSFELKASLPYARLGVSDYTMGELRGIDGFEAKAGAIASSSLTAVPSKEHSETCSQSHEMKQSNSVSTAHSSKPHGTNKANHKRLNPGEKPRPRPKDRQMIQDRLKELRELVPNGAKCSIDALLGRTIKHMLFLQSVTKHADKLKRTAEAKVVNDEDGSFAKDNFEGGATWAYEIGSQSMICPIIVKDLNQPRQMLVEMLCEERGSFLEIADAIRGLGLTILKGLMEIHNDKIRVRFVIEANRDISRMEISLSLVRLLEQNPKGCMPHNCNDTQLLNSFTNLHSSP